MRGMKKESHFNYDYIKQVVEIPLLLRLSFSNNKQKSKPKKILIINTCLIGDILASLPAMISFIEKSKNAQIDVIVPSSAKDLIEKVKGINRVYIAKSVSNRKHEKNLMPSGKKKELLAENYDLIVVMRLSKDAFYMVKALKPKQVKVSFFTYTRYLLHLLKHVVYKRRGVKQYRELNFELVDEDKVHKKFEEIFSFSKQDYQEIQRLAIMRGRGKKVLIHAGSGWRKNWPNNRWANLLKKVNKIGNFKFIFIGSTDQEEENFKAIKKQLNFRVYSLIKKTNLSQLMLIMRESDYFIGIDSGPRNMAHVAELRSVSLLGPGPKHFMPLSEKDVIIDKSNCKCTHLFCFKKKKCMNEITSEDVFKGFKKLIKINKKSHKSKV
jgi:ADP-heptose:LPS heptosyltransferase